MNIRTALKRDYETIYELVKTAFETAQVSDGTEQDFVLRLRDSSAFLPELEFVAEENGLLIGHILLTRQPVLLSAGTLSAVLVAPLCVALPYRNQNVGGRLLRHAGEQAVKLGFAASFLVGNPDYYGRFGYRRGGDFGIQNQSGIPDQFVLGCELVTGAFQGVSGTLSEFAQ